jgi:trk system potassium uptake protein TrkA
MLETFNLQVVSSTSWGAQRLEELIYHAEVRTLYSAGNGEIEFYEVDLPDEKNGITVADVQVKDHSMVVSVTRAGRAILPSPEMVLHGGDLLTISATFEGIEALRDLLELEKGA